MVTAINSGAAAKVSGAGPTTGADAASPAAVSAGVSGSAAYLSALLAATAPAADAGASGLRAPVNPENAEALLLLVESQSDRANAATRGASLASRFGAAQNAIGSSSAALRDAAGALTAAGGKLAASQNKLAADKAAGASSDVLDADQKAVDADTASAAAAHTALQTLMAGADAPAAVSLIGKELRADVAQDASRTNVRSARRDVAYEDVAATAKRFRDGEVDRAHRGGTEPARDGAKRDEDRGAALAAALAAGTADAMATIGAFLASRPPAVPPTAAAEAGGRLRLSL